MAYIERSTAESSSELFEICVNGIRGLSVREVRRHNGVPDSELLELGSTSSFAEALALDGTRSLQRLAVRGCDDREEGAGFGVLAHAIVSARLTQLRELQVNAEAHGRETTSAVTCDARAIWAAAPGLRRLVISARAVQLGAIAAPELEHLELHSLASGRDELAAIARGDAPKLASLVVCFDGSRPHSGVFDPIVGGQPVFSLKHLSVRHASDGDALCRMLTRSRLTSTLESLDLIECGVTNAGVRALVAHHASFERLRALNLRHNPIDRHAQRTLRAVMPFARVIAPWEGETYTGCVESSPLN